MGKCAVPPNFRLAPFTTNNMWTAGVRLHSHRAGSVDWVPPHLAQSTADLWFAVPSLSRQLPAPGPRNRRSARPRTAPPRALSLRPRPPLNPVATAALRRSDHAQQHVLMFRPRRYSLRPIGIIRARDGACDGNPQPRCRSAAAHNPFIRAPLRVRYRASTRCKPMHPHLLSKQERPRILTRLCQKVTVPHGPMAGSTRCAARAARQAMRKWRKFGIKACLRV